MRTSSLSTGVKSNGGDITSVVRGGASWKRKDSEEERAWGEIRSGAWIQLLYFRCMTVVWYRCEYDASCELEMPHYAIVVPDNPS